MPLVGALSTEMPLAGALPPLLDVFLINDEIEMLRYRLALHAPLAVRTIVAESRWTHSGHPKPLHARNNLTDEELVRFNIRCVDVPFPRLASEHSSRNKSAASSNSRNALDVEIAHRRYLHGIIGREMRALLPALLPATVSAETAAPSDLLVHFSDVDELLDLASLRRAVQLAGSIEAVVPACRSPMLRHYYYGVHCPTKTTEMFNGWAP